MKIIEYKAHERGYGNYDWLQANYSFSFANYHNPNKTNFGALRVLNDDVIQGGQGFAQHPHHNMEIITIPLHGSLKHKDSMSNKWVPIETDEVQVMSAGKGIMHSERNNSPTEYINLFQIWIIPDKTNVDPSYHQMKFDPSQRKNSFQTLVSSWGDDENPSLKIHQDAKISRIDLAKDLNISYGLKSVNHGVYIMVISGSASIMGYTLNIRDALGIYETSECSLTAHEDSEILLIEVPMNY